MILVTIQIYDDDSGAISSQEIHTHSGTYGYEVVRLFELLGEKTAKKVDPGYEP